MQTVIVTRYPAVEEHLRNRYSAHDAEVVDKADADFMMRLAPGTTLIGEVPLVALFAYPHRKLNYLHVELSRGARAKDATVEDVADLVRVYPLQLIAGSLRPA